MMVRATPCAEVNIMGAHLCSFFLRIVDNSRYVPVSWLSTLLSAIPNRWFCSADKSTIRVPELLRNAEAKIFIEVSQL